MRLCDARRDQLVEVKAVDAAARDLLLRLGIGEGCRLRCLERLPGGGPLVVSRGCWELAVDRELCRQVEVVPARGL